MMRCCTPAKGTKKELGVVLVAGENFAEFGCLLDGRAVNERVAVEVDELDAAAAPHHLPCGDGRVYAARHQSHRLAAGVHGHASVALNRLEIDEHSVVHNVYEYLQVRSVQPHPCSCKLLHKRTHFDIYLTRPPGEALVGAVRGNSERVEAQAGQLGTEEVLDGFQIRRDLRRKIELGYAHAVGYAAAHGIPVGVLTERKADHQVRLPDPFDARALDGAAQVAREAAQEHRTVLAFERGFVEFYYYEAFSFHRQHFSARADIPPRKQAEHPVTPARQTGQLTGVAGCK